MDLNNLGWNVFFEKHLKAFEQHWQNLLRKQKLLHDTF